MAKKKVRTPAASDIAHDAADVACVYDERYSGRRWWMLGIKLDKERRQLPCHSHVCGGMAWQQGTQRQVDADGWAALDDHRSRVVRGIYSYEQIREAVGAVRHFVVRWQRHAHHTPQGQSEGYATQIISLANRHKVKDDATKQFRPSGWRYQPLPTDEPLAKYLVLVPRRMLETRRGFLPRIEELPSMLDLDPRLVPERLVALMGDESLDDEPW